MSRMPNRTSTARIAAGIAAGIALDRIWLMGLLLLGLLAASLTLSPAFAQNAPNEMVGAGEDVNEPVPPGLGARTPSAQPIAPEDVPIYIPHSDQIIGRVSIPDAKLATLVQPEGRDWRTFRMVWLQWIAAIAILGTLVALAAFFLFRGRIRIEKGWSGRWVPRFNLLERAAHWITAISFIVLALTGLVITFGRFTLIPLIGHPNFTALSEISKYLHNFSSLPFVFGLVLMVLFWLKDNIPNRTDIRWIREMLSSPGRNDTHVPVGRFNAGQKGIFWVVVLGGLLMAVTGWLMLAPFYVTGIGGMQIVHVVHSVLAALMVAVILAHIYIGTLGMEGAFSAMGRGEVDENWAKEHHPAWYEKIRGTRHAPPAGAHRQGAE